jgi:DNA-binding MarR family transcriptional regulator
MSTNRELPKKTTLSKDFQVLDAYSALRRELSLMRAAEMKDLAFGHNQLVLIFRLSQSSAALNELAEYTSSDKASTSRTVASLEEAGFVKRVPHKTDRRISMIELTSKGRKMAEQTTEIRNYIGENVNATLTVAEQKTLASLLNKVVQGLREQRNSTEQRAKA